MSHATLIEKVLSYPMSHPEAKNLNLKERARRVLLEEDGREPTGKAVLQLYVAAKRVVANQRADRAELQEIKIGFGNDGKEQQTRGGHRVIHKADGFS